MDVAANAMDMVARTASSALIGWRDGMLPLGSVLGAMVVHLLLVKLRARNAAGEMRQRAQRKRKERDDLRAKWPKEWDNDDGVKVGETLVVDMTVSQLLAAMRDGKLTSEQATRSFIARALAAGELWGLTADEPFEAAVKEAKQRDKERKQGQTEEGLPLGPLHGVPISVKDQYHQKGCDSTCGLACRTLKPQKEDGWLLATVRAAGAVPFVRTNVPQSLLFAESMNETWGEACNPYDAARTVGGSSGGEGGLIAARGSPLGLGTDVAGSIRIPSALCGIYGFKPTQHRMTGSGTGIPRLHDVNGLMCAIKGVAGPMGRNVDDLELIMKVWCGAQTVPRPMWEEDPTVPVQPWDASRAQAGGKKLKFGYYVSDGFFEPAPACSRAVHEAVRALREAGHTCVEVKFPGLYDLVLNYMSIQAAEGGMRSVREGLEGEALHPYYSFFLFLASLPACVRACLWRVLRVVPGMRRTSDLVRETGAVDVHGLWGRVGRRDCVLKPQLIGQWQELGLDALLTPGLGLAAWKRGMGGKVNMACSYCFLWNNLAFPAGAVPVSTVRADEEEYSPGPFRDMLAKSAKAATVGSKGLPVGVQVVALPFQDEECVRAMREVEGALRDAPRPGPPSVAGQAWSAEAELKRREGRRRRT